MKKSVKIIASLLLAVMMIIGSQERTLAYSTVWAAVKVPGTGGTSADTIMNIPLTKGKITFKVTELTGNCSYLIGQCVSTYTNYGYINNSNRSVSVSTVNGEDYFYMSFTTAGAAQDYMYLTCSAKHNASSSELVKVTGTLSY